MPRKSNRGRPKSLLTQDERELRAKVDNYLTSHELHELTYAGLARATGYRSVRRLAEDAEKRGGSLCDAFLLITDLLERQLRTPEKDSSASKIIFALKQAGYTDTQLVQTEVKAVNLNMNLTTSLDDVAKLLHPSMEEQTLHEC